MISTEAPLYVLACGNMHIIGKVELKQTFPTLPTFLLSPDFFADLVESFTVHSNFCLPNSCNMAAVAQSLCSREGIDDASAALILDFQLADIETVQAQNTGKQNEGTGTDAEIALLMTYENLKILRSTISDRRTTQSIAEAVQHDGHLVAAAASEEEIAQGDRAFAQRLNGNRVTPEDQT